MTLKLPIVIGTYSPSNYQIFRQFWGLEESDLWEDDNIFTWKGPVGKRFFDSIVPILFTHKEKITYTTVGTLQ